MIGGSGGQVVVREEGISTITCCALQQNIMQEKCCLSAACKEEGKAYAVVEKVG